MIDYILKFAKMNQWSSLSTNIGQLKKRHITVAFPRAFVPELYIVCCDLLLNKYAPFTTRMIRI